MMTPDEFVGVMMHNLHRHAGLLVTSARGFFLTTSVFDERFF
ncbi:MAG: hypothetical protein WC391_02495 [Methanoregula sp.]